MRRKEQMVYLYGFLMCGLLAIGFHLIEGPFHIDIEHFVLISLAFGIGALLFNRFLYYLGK